MNDLAEGVIEQEVVAEVKVSLKPPSLYNVLMHNDDFTPMEFVVEVLEAFFNKDHTLATKTMYEIHTMGKAVCGTYSKDVAYTKINQVMVYAEQHDHPLLCSAEMS